METLTQIAIVIVAMYVLAEVAAAVYILRNRNKVGTRMKYALRNLLGLNDDMYHSTSAFSRLESKINLLDRKMNYVGKHVKFEREQLRKLGILKDSTQAASKPLLKQ